MKSLSDPPRDFGSFGNVAVPSAATLWENARVLWLASCLLCPGEGTAARFSGDWRGEFKGPLGAGGAAAPGIGSAGGDAAGTILDGAERPGIWAHLDFGGRGASLVDRAGLGGSATAMGLGAGAWSSDRREVLAEDRALDWQGGDEGGGSLAGGLGLASGPVFWRGFSERLLSDGPGGSVADRIVGSGLAPGAVCAAAKGLEFGRFWFEGGSRSLLLEVARGAGGMDLGQASFRGADGGVGDCGRRGKEEGGLAFGEGASLGVEGAASAVGRASLEMDSPNGECGGAGGESSGSDWDFEMDLGGRTVAVPVVGSTCGLLLGLASFAFRRRRYS